MTRVSAFDVSAVTGLKQLGISLGQYRNCKTSGFPRKLVPHCISPTASHSRNMHQFATWTSIADCRPAGTRGSGMGEGPCEALQNCTDKLSILLHRPGVQAMQAEHTYQFHDSGLALAETRGPVFCNIAKSIDGAQKKCSPLPVQGRSTPC